MEWVVLVLWSLAFILAIIILHKYGDTNVIYSKRIANTLKDNRKMVSVSPVKLPYSVQLEQSCEPGLLSFVIQGEKKCTVTSYVCVNQKGENSCFCY